MAKIDKSREEEPNQTELVQFRCSVDIKSKLQKLAEQEGLNISKYMRKIAIRKVTASERPVTPTNTVTTGVSSNEWDKKAIQDLFMVLATILGIVMIFRLFTR